jgi:hypothetical protein
MRHEKIVAYRKKYGDNWITIFPDGLEIPWRQLTLQEFLDYTDLLNSGRYTEIEIEDEVFCKCVLQELFIENIDILPTGTIAAVVAQILQCSGPQTIDQINQDLAVAREQTSDFMSHIATLICSVFPAYKPEDLFAMKYSDFMKRAAMAEARLMELGIRREPLQAVGPGEVAVQTVVERPSDKRRRELLEERKAEMEKKMQQKLGNLNHLEGVITKDKMKDGAMSFVPDLSMDPQDHLINKKRMEEAKAEALTGLEHIYPEYFKMLKEGKKITPDTINQTKGKTPEEVKKNYEKYTEKVVSGEIKPLPPKPEPVKLQPKKPIKVKRK